MWILKVSLLTHFCHCVQNYGWVIICGQVNYCTGVECYQLLQCPEESANFISQVLKLKDKNM